MSKNKFEKHIITQEDLDLNPELVEQGIKVGDEVLLGEPVGSAEAIAILEKAIEDKDVVIAELEKEMKVLAKENAKLKKSADKVAPVVDIKNTNGEVIVHFGVNINGKDYTVADILEDKDIQNYLLEIGSGAIEKVTEG